MKNTIKYIAAAMLLGITATSCRDESILSNAQGEGKMTLHTSVMSEIKVVSRALSEEQQNHLCSSALIWISDAQKGLLYKYKGLSSFPADGLPLTAGSYVAEAWVGDSIPASWSGVRYHGRETFDITAGATTQVNLVCPVRNTLVSLKLSDKIANVLTDVSMTISLNDGITDGSHSLVFEDDKLAEKGYYMINTRTKGFLWTLTGTDMKGNEFTRSGEYKDPAVADAPFLSRATEYIFNVKYDVTEGEIEIGGAYLDIEVNPEPVEGTEQEVLIALAPEIVGLDGLDLSRTQLGEPGDMERKSIHVIGSSVLKSVQISGNLLTQAGLRDYDLITMDEQHINELLAAGIDFTVYNHGDNSGTLTETADRATATNLRLNLEEAFTNAIPAGEYELNILATDSEGKTSTATLSINVSDAPGQLDPINESTVSYTSATMTASIKKPGSKMGFEVKKISTGRAYEDWTFVEGTLNGSLLTATPDDLDAGTEYTFRLVVDDYTSALEYGFTTLSYPQLPNAGFENWQKPAKPWLIYGSGDEMYWDSGNHGSTSVSADGSITTPDETIKHGGKYSAKLVSTFVGVSFIGKFAAGNIFTGQYLKTDGTDGVLGWGRPFDCPKRPKALRGYIKYTPVNITHTSLDNVKKGEADTGIVYIALLTDATDEEEKEFPGWPVIIKTKTSERQLFDSSAANVVAYGEKIFEGATSGDGLVEFEIPLNDVHGSLEVKNIIVVASASRYGDYFTGGNGSTMWLDDLELVY